MELEILRLGRGLAGADLLRTRVAFKEATVDKIAADPKYNPWKAQLEEQDRAEIRRILEVAQRELVALRYQRMKHEIALKSVMRAAGQYDVAGPGVSDQPSSPDESVWQMMTPESGNILIRLRPGMNPEIDRAALAESILMAEAERSFIARFLAAHQRATRR